MREETEETEQLQIKIKEWRKRAEDGHADARFYLGNAYLDGKGVGVDKEEGVKWLFVRLQPKSIRNGRFDLELIIMDESGDIVALSHHVCLVMSAARNIAKYKACLVAQGFSQVPGVDYFETFAPAAKLASICRH